MKKRAIGLGLVILSGLLALFNIGFTGAVIGGSSSWFAFVSLGVFLGGVVLVFVETNTADSKLVEIVDSSPLTTNYYKQRINELVKYKGDAWISQWEAEGIMQELINRGYQLEHGSNSPTIHLGGRGPKFDKHMYIQKGKRGISKHLYITPDPQDKRLMYVGFKENRDKILKVPGKVYYPNHPRLKNQKYTSRTEVS